MLNKLEKASDTLSSLFSNLAFHFGLNEAGEGVSSSIEAIEKLVEQETGGAVSLSQYLSYRYFDETEKLFFNDGSNVGFMIEISPIVGVNDDLIKNLSYFFNDEMPDNCFIQFLMIASHDVDKVLELWKSARTSTHPVLQKLTANRAAFVQEMATDFKNFDGRIARDYRIYINVSQKCFGTNKGVDGAVSEVVSFRERFLNKLSTINLNTRICEVSDLMFVVSELVQMSLTKERPSRYDPMNIIADQILMPLRNHRIDEDAIVQEDSGLTSKCYYARELPREFSLAQMIGLLGSSNNNALGIPARFVMSYVVASDINSGVSSALMARGTRTIEAAEQWYMRNDRDIKREAAEWREIKDRVKNGQKFLTESFAVMITAPHDQIKLAEQCLISLYNISDFRLEVNHNLQLLALLSILPMQQPVLWQTLKNFKLTRTCISEEVIARLPIHAEWKGMPRSGVMLHARRGQLFNWNPFHTISSGNYNVVVFGPSGGGKSVFLQELVVSLVSQGTRAFVLDIGQSFANICELLGGEKIQFGKDAGIAINPFASFSVDMSIDDRNEFLKCTKAVLEIMCGIKDDSVGSGMLEKAISDALQQSNYKMDITQFAEYLERVGEQNHSDILKHYSAALYSYTKHGLYGKYFTGNKSASFKEMMTVFEFEEIKNDPKLLAIVLQILLMEVTNQFFTGDRTTPFIIIVDEAWMLLDFAAPFFAAFVRTVRKYGGSLVICVQNFMDQQKTVDHRTILENSSWTLMLKQDEKGLEAFKTSDAFKDMVPLIQSISLSPGKYSELLLYSSGIKVIGRLVLDPYSKALYFTNAADFSYLRQAKSEGVSLEDAIEALAQRKR